MAVAVGGRGEVAKSKEHGEGSGDGGHRAEASQDESGDGQMKVRSPQGKRARAGEESQIEGFDHTSSRGEPRGTK